MKRYQTCKNKGGKRVLCKEAEPCRPWYSSGSILSVMGSQCRVEAEEYHMEADALLCSKLTTVGQEWK